MRRVYRPLMCEHVPHSFFMSSSRLGFRTWTQDDLNLAIGLWGDADVTKLTGGPFDAGQVRERLENEIGNQQDFGFQYWPIFWLDSGRHVGCCGLRPRQIGSGVLELGFQIRRDAWGQGIASEASDAVIAWAKAQGFSALIAGHHPQNHASRQVLRRLGFRYTHDELYEPTGLMEPCYSLPLKE